MPDSATPRARATTDIQAWRIGLATAFCVVWELVARNVTSLLLPSASATLVALAELLATADLWRALLTSHEALLVGFVAASLIGVPAGLALGLWPRMARWFDPHHGCSGAMCPFPNTSRRTASCPSLTGLCR